MVYIYVFQHKNSNLHNKDVLYDGEVYCMHYIYSVEVPYKGRCDDEEEDASK